MLRVIFSLTVLCIAMGAQAATTQTIKCENKAQGLTFNVKLDNFTDDTSEADVRMSVNKKKGTVFQGSLVREKLSQASNPGSIAISGEGSARNFSLEIILAQSQLKKNFKNIIISAFMDNPLSDQGFYPHRVPVKCTSRIN